VTVTVNGEPVDVEDAATVERLLVLRGVPDRGTAVAVDGEVVPRSRWPGRVLGAGQQVEILTAMQGG
jgi:sulfur carrier protein